MESLPSKVQLITRSLVIAGGLVVFKFAVFWVTNSMAILASAADSLMDFFVSLANYFLVSKAVKPADHNHPYGHGKIESLAGLIQSLVIGGVTVAIAVSAFRRFTSPQEIHEPVAGLIVMAVALAFNVWHVRNLRASMLSTASAVMTTEYLHYVSDTFVYIGVFASLLLYRMTGATFWDPLITIGIVIYLLKSAAEVFRESLGELLDEQLPEPILLEIKNTIRRYHPQVIDFHDLRTRKVGLTKFIEFHVVLRGVQKFDEAHDLTEGLISQLRKRFPGSIVTVHTDPEGAVEMEEEN